GKKPGGANRAVIGFTARDRRVSIGGKTYTGSLLGGAYGSGTHVLGSLLGPNPCGPSVEPGRTHIGVVPGSPDRNGVSVGGDCHRGPLQSRASAVGRGQLGSLLDPCRAGPDEYPHRSDTGIVRRTAYNGGGTIGR